MKRYNKKKVKHHKKHKQTSKQFNKPEQNRSWHASKQPNVYMLMCVYANINTFTYNIHMCAYKNI